MSRRVTSVALALPAAVALAYGGYSLGSQAGDGDAVAAREGGSNPASTRFVHDRRGERRGAGLEQLADRLGVSAAALRAALDDLRPNREDLAQDLAAELNVPVDKVTQALADARPGPRAHKRGGRVALAAALAKELDTTTAKVREAFLAARREDSRADALAAAAKVLGVSESRLREALRDLRPQRGERRRGGHGFDDLADKLGVSQARLREAMRKIHDARRDAFVTALADRLNVDEQKVEDVLGDFRGPGPGHHGRRGFRRGGP